MTLVELFIKQSDKAFGKRGNEQKYGPDYCTLRSMIKNIKNEQIVVNLAGCIKENSLRSEVQRILVRAAG